MPLPPYISETDKAYIAGFFDADGCVIIKRSQRKARERFIKYYYNLRVFISNTDLDTLEWINKTIGFGTINLKVRNKNSNDAHCWNWQSSCRQAYDFLKIIFPYLKVKTKRAEIGIEFQEGLIKKGKSRLTQNENDRREKLYQKMRKLNKRGKNNAKK
jgi:hypothetical protein